MRVAVVGSRDFPDLFSVRRFVQELVKTFGRDVVIVSGGARGVDRTAENEARRLGLRRDIYLVPEGPEPFWVRAFRRNGWIVDAADYVVAFQFNQSRGTGNAIAQAKEAGKPTHVVPKGA